MKYQFIHIPKNGGAAFSEFIKYNYADIFENSLPHHQFLVESSDNPVVIVREPLERISSIYQFWNNGSEIFNECRNLTFDEFLEGAERIINFVPEEKRDIESIMNQTREMSVPFLALPQSRWLRKQDYHKTIVIKYQNDLNEIFSVLLDELCITKLHKELKSFNVTRNKIHMNFSPEQLNKIIVLYLDDFLLWHDVLNAPDKFKKVV